MYEIGDYVTIKNTNPQKVGQIVNWLFDEGNVWIVVCDGETFECGDHELAPALDAYGHPY
jgi:hypothetical protein